MRKKKIPKISLICAVARKNRAIGKDNKLLWSIPKDLEHFKKITLGRPVVMGRKTFESIGRPLPERDNIVLSPDISLKIDGVDVLHSIDEVIEYASQKDDEEIFFIGGGSVYQQTIGLADKLYLTLVDGDYIGDTFFPDYSDFDKIVSQEKGESNGYKYEFIELERSKKKVKSEH